MRPCKDAANCVEPSPLKKWGGGGEILKGMRGSTHNTFPEPQIPVFNNLLDRCFMLNIPKSKGLSQKPINLTGIWYKPQHLKP